MCKYNPKKTHDQKLKPTKDLEAGDQIKPSKFQRCNITEVQKQFCTCSFGFAAATAKIKVNCYPNFLVSSFLR